MDCMGIQLHVSSLINILNSHKNHDFKHELSLSYMQLFFHTGELMSKSCMTEGCSFGPLNGMGIIYIHINKLP